MADWFGPVAFMAMDAQLTLNGCPLFGGTGHTSAQSPESRLLGAPILTVPSLVKSANPRTYVTPGDAKFLVMHGTKDCTVPYQQSQAMANRLNAVMPGSATLLLLTGAAHGGAAWTSASTVDIVSTFFRNNL